MGLRSYLLKRGIVAVFILWVVATLNFMIFVAYPGDPVAFLLDPNMDEYQKEQIRIAWGYYDPWPVKYLKYLRNMFSFGIIPPYFGIDLVSRRTVASGLWWRMALSVALLGQAMIGTILIGIPTGIIAATRRGTKLDVAIVGSGLFTYGVPTFFVQLVILLFIIVNLYQNYGIQLFPAGGWISYPRPEGLINTLIDVEYHILLPIITLVIAGFGGWTLYTRNMMLDALTQDYITTARAKGLRERTVLLKHALKSLYPPLVTMITLSIPGLITGAVITETIFGLEGMGKWYIDALSLARPNYPVVEAVLFCFAALTILCNFIADILYGIVDPRIRVGGRG